MADAEGVIVFPGPSDVQLHVRIAAHGVPRERLVALVEKSQRCSPIPNAVENPVPVALHVEVEA
jgi:hypothetical protein